MWGINVRWIRHLIMVIVPVLTVALVCATTHLSVPPDQRIRAASYAYIPTASIDTDATALGVAESNLYFMTPAEVNVAMDALQSLGVTQIRIFVPWRAIELVPGQYTWTDVDKVVNAAASRGIGIAAAVTSSPLWASDWGLIAPNGQPKKVNDYANFVSKLATRYGPTEANGGQAGITAYEIWNEPNGFVGWTPNPSAKAYTKLLKAAFAAIKAADPTATVIGGVLGAGVSMGVATINPVDFVKQMYAAGAGNYFDALSLHPYNFSSTFSAGSSWDDTPIQQVKAIRALMDKYGDAQKLIWATEYGISTAPGLFNEAQQAAYLKDFLDTWATMPGVGPMFVYSLIDQWTGSNDVENNWGLYTDNWTPKQAAQVIADWIAAHPLDPTVPHEYPVGGNPGASAPVDRLAAAMVSLLNAFSATIGGFVGNIVGTALLFSATMNVVMKQMSSVGGKLQSVFGQIWAKVVDRLSSIGQPTARVAAAGAVNSIAVGEISGNVPAVAEATRPEHEVEVSTTVASTDEVPAAPVEAPAVEAPAVEEPAVETPVTDVVTTPEETTPEATTPEETAPEVEVGTTEGAEDLQTETVPTDTDESESPAADSDEKDGTKPATVDSKADASDDDSSTDTKATREDDDAGKSESVSTTSATRKQSTEDGASSQPPSRTVSRSESSGGSDTGSGGGSDGGDD